ncbi:Fc receptor-like protein 5 [Lissotriton helveticus]
MSPAYLGLLGQTDLDIRGQEWILRPRGSPGSWCRGLALFRLSFVSLAVYLSAHLPVTSAGHLSSPTISYSAGYTTYLIGESASLKCNSPTIARGFRFYKDGRAVNGPQDPALDTFRIASVNRGNQGSYTCTYWVEMSGQEVRSVESLAVQLHVLEHPATPHLSLEPKYSVYLRGESVGVHCEVQVMASPLEYHFFKDGAKVVASRGTSESTYVIASADSQSAGSYTCQYLIHLSGRLLTSMLSSPVSLYVTDQPEAPTISYQPLFPVFIIGEALILQCKAFSAATVSGYRFYHAGREVVHWSGPAPGMFEISKVHPDQQGAYSCIYWTKQAEREIPSLESSAVLVYVIEPLLPPILMLIPLDGQVADGDIVTLQCLPRTRHMNLTAHFTTGHSEILHNISKTRNAYSFQVTSAQDSNGKNYSCYHEVDVRGRKLRSPTSMSVQVTVQARLVLWPIITGTVLGFLLAVVLVLCLCWALCPKHRGAASVREDTSAQSSPPKDDTDLAYVSLTWSTQGSSHSRLGSTTEIFC